jgi:hypothetical protein
MIAHVALLRLSRAMSHSSDSRTADPIEELYHRWEQNPTSASTVSMCEALRADPRAALVQRVGDLARERHANDALVLVSVARMYVETHRYSDAQTVLVAAGKEAPREPQVYRWLGEVLLRRGDADRAEKVLERAMALEPRDADAQRWLERARRFRPLQGSGGVRAVAAEMASVTDRASGTRQPAGRPAAGGPPTRGRPLPRLSSEIDVEETATTEVFETEVFGRDDGVVLRGHLPLPTSPPVPKGLEPKVAVPIAAEPPRVGDVARPAPPPVRRPADADGPPLPHPRDVLDALALSGLFEPRTEYAGSVAGWDRAARAPRRTGATATLVAGMVLFLSASVGVFFFYKHKRAQEHLQAEALLVAVEARLYAARPDELQTSEADLARAFQLESRSPRAALDWARERVLAGLVKGGADIALEDAMTRAGEVGVREDRYAFVRVASFLLQGDTAGAAAVLPRWEGPAATDAWFQLVAGAALERAGDARARDRYAAAVRLDPDLYAAKVALSRATAIDGEAHESMRLAKVLRTATPDRAEPIALVALAWACDPNRDDIPAPAEVDELPRREAELPSGLRFVPHAIAALVAMDKRGPADPRAEVRAGLAAAESPGAAVWLGRISLPLGDEGLARKAALAALQLSAAYEPARALAARVALLGGRIDEALKATEDLDPTAPDVAVVRAASAYERVDADGVSRALEGLAPEGRKAPFLAGLDHAIDALSGKMRLDSAKLLVMAGDDAPWADLVAMDIALCSGDIASADKIASGWAAETGKQAEAESPPRALRLARLARYEGRLDAADALSQSVLAHATVTARVLWERAYVLVAKGRGAEVGPLLARYPLVLGPVATWLSAYAAASGGAIDVAKGKTASVDPPAASAPFEARVVAAASLGAMKDRRRGGDYVREALSTGSLHPDLVAAALALGLHRVDHGRRPPTYE